MTVRGNPLSRSLLGAKRTWIDALQMSAFDPKRTSREIVMTLLTQSGSGDCREPFRNRYRILRTHATALRD
jgi:hypothetical protein